MNEISAPIVSENTAMVPATPTLEATAMLQMIKDVATTPGVNIEAIRAMLDMQRQLVQDQAERSLNLALAELAPKLPHVKKNGKIPLPSSKDGAVRDVSFAKWEDVDTAIRPLLAQFGLSLSFTSGPRQGDGGGAVMTGRVSHVQGAYREAQISLPLDTGPGRNNLQAMGSTISYGKKYLAFMLLNIVTEGDDDDGNSAEPITIEQAAAIDTKLAEIGANKKKFLALFKVDDVRKIQQRDFAKASALLAAKATEKKSKQL